MKVALVRHLATAWTEAGRLQGRRDEPLLDRPVAPPVGLTELQGAVAWCSTLRRTQQTARQFGFSGAMATPLLDELDFGPFEGRTRDELLAATDGAWITAPFATALGPALRELEGRIERFVADVLAGKGPRIAFGHGVWIRLLLAKVQVGDPSQVNRIDLPTGSLVEVDL